jgi:hypothetical protein
MILCITLKSLLTFTALYGVTPQEIVLFMLYFCLTKVSNDLFIYLYMTHKPE